MQRARQLVHSAGRQRESTDNGATVLFPVAQKEEQDKQSEDAGGELLREAPRCPARHAYQPTPELLRASRKRGLDLHRRYPRLLGGPLHRVVQKLRAVCPGGASLLRQVTVQTHRL